MRLSIFILTLVVMTLSLVMLSACGWGPEGVTVSARVRFYTGTEQGVVSIYNQRLNQVQRINAPPEVQKEGYTLVGWFQTSTLRGVHAASEGVHSIEVGSEAEFPFDLQGRNLAFGFFASWKPNGSVITEEGFVLKPYFSEVSGSLEKSWVFIGLHPTVQPTASWTDTLFEFPISYGGFYIRAIKRHSVQGQHFRIGTGGYTFLKVPFSVLFVDQISILTPFNSEGLSLTSAFNRHLFFLENKETKVQTNRPENIFTD